MSNAISLLIVCAGLLCGCAHEHFKKGRGDVGQFIIHQAIKRGGTPTMTNNLPALAGHWRFFEDQYGIVIRMPREQYPAVESFLRLSFGEPKFGPTENVDGGKLGGYRLTSKGGGIQFGYDAKEAHVTIIRPLSKQEFSDSLKRAFQDKEFQKELLKNSKENP